MKKKSVPKNEVVYSLYPWFRKNCAQGSNKNSFRKNNLEKIHGTGKSLEELEKLDKDRIRLQELEKIRLKELEKIRLQELKRIRIEELERIHGTGKSLEELERLEKNRIKEPLYKIDKSESYSYYKDLYG